MSYIRNGKKVEVKTRKVGTVPLEYMEDYLAIHHVHAEGEIDGRKFKLNDSGAKIYVTFTGLKGSLPSMAIDVETLVDLAYKAAKKEKLFKP